MGRCGVPRLMEIVSGDRFVVLRKMLVLWCVMSNLKSLCTMLV